MKKIYIFILISLFSFMLIKTDNVKAYDEADYLITEEISNSFFNFYTNINYEQDEMFITLDKIFFKNNSGVQWIYQKYLELKINQNNLFEIEVDSAINGLDFFDTGNVKELYFILEFNNLNTVDGQFKSDNSNITYIDSKTLKYSLDPNNIEQSIFFNVWFAGISNPNIPVETSGSIRITGLRLYLKMLEPVSTLRDVKSNYSLLPDKEELRNDFIRIDSLEPIYEATRSYKLFFKHNSLTYAFDVSFPTEVDLTKIWNVDNKLNMSFSVDPETNDRLLYIQPDPIKNPYPVKNGTIEDPADLMVGFTTINLTQNNYYIIKKMQLPTIVAYEEKNNAYMYAFFNWKIDDLINIRVKYTYRYRYFGFPGEWQTVENLYAWKETSSVNVPWWLSMNAPIFGLITNAFNVYDVQTIKPINYYDLTSYVKDRYINNIKGNESDLKTLSIYKVHLGQFNKLLTTGYEISEHKVMEITYLYKDIVYQVPYDLIDQIPDNPDPKSTIGELDFAAFLKFTGVKDIPTFLGHVVKYWQETLLTILILIIKIIVIVVIIKIIRFVKPRRNYYRMR